MTYEQALEYLYERLPMFQRIGAAAIKKDLTNTVKMLDALNDPHQHFKSIHIAGTNGKGTSAHALAAILQMAGYKTGLYTSPHLKSFTERIRVDGAEVSKDYVGRFVSENKELIETVNPSFFEVTVAMAFDYFRKEQVEIAVVETGLGGRLDSTNVINPEVALITMIGWDHADMLGESLELIASEKAGIIKTGRPVVIGANQPDLLPVFKKKADEAGAILKTVDKYQVINTRRAPTFQLADVFRSGEVLFENLQTDITAGYFLKNLPGILEVVELLRSIGWEIGDAAIRDGLSSIKSVSGLKGRWHILNQSPMIVADISHNAPGLESLFGQVTEMGFDHLHLVFGVVRDKDLSRIFPLLPDATYYFTQSHVPRSLSAIELREKAIEAGLDGETHENVNDAIVAAKKKASQKDLILICGSTFVVAEIDEL